jgi:hypothetical protein
MVYSTDADLRSYSANYVVSSVKNYSHNSEYKPTEGMFGRDYYTTDFLPVGYTLKFSDFNPQALADYLLLNTVQSDPRVSKTLSEHFWDYD